MVTYQMECSMLPVCPNLTCFLKFFNRGSIKGTKSEHLCLMYAYFVLYLCMGCFCSFDLRKSLQVKGVLKCVFAYDKV